MSAPLLLAILLAPQPAAPAQPTTPEIPAVVLSDHHKKMCRVGVGDAMPKLQPRDAAGRPVDLAKLRGARATVVAFFKGNGWMTKTMRADLARDVAGPFADRGVNVVAINVGGAAERSGAFPTLADPGGKEFAKVGSGRLPRVYVLGPATDDEAGEIVWFDIEYSRSTRRELRRTLEALTTAGVARAN